MPAPDETRLIVRVSRLYYESGLKQPEIAARLGLNQVKVSRLLKQALDRDIVRITVRTPEGIHADLEESIEDAYGLTEVVVVDTATSNEGRLLRDLGVAAAGHLERTLRAGDVVGISTWSASLLAAVRAMHPLANARNIRVVQLLGGVGSPAADGHATELTRQLAALLKGSPVLLPVPGVVGTRQARKVLEDDAHVRAATELFDDVTVALVGIGAVEPSPVLARSGNVFSPGELDEVQSAGGVGDVLLRFFDADGQPVRNPLDERVIGMRLDQLRKVPRSIAVAGGKRKAAAISSALRGRLVNHLITDVETARQVLDAAR